MLREPVLLLGKGHNFRPKKRRYSVSQQDSCVTIREFLGDVGYVVTRDSIVHIRLISSFRRSLLKQSRKRLKFWHWFVFSAQAFSTKKPKEIRMGKGKGSFFRWEHLASPQSFFFSYTFSTKLLPSLSLFLLRQLMVKLGVLCWRVPRSTGLCNGGRGFAWFRNYLF